MKIIYVHCGEETDISDIPVGLLAQLVERCTGIAAEVMGSNPLRIYT